MQIGNHYQNNPNFTGFRVRGGAASLDRIMETFEADSTPKILKSLQVIRREARNPRPIDIEDLGYCGGLEACGHWEAVVGDKIYTNSNMYTRSAYDNAHFLNKLSKKNHANKIHKIDTKISEQNDKLELLEMKKRIKNGENEQNIRDNLLDQIFELIKIK